MAVKIALSFTPWLFFASKLDIANGARCFLGLRPPDRKSSCQTELAAGLNGHILWFETQESKMAGTCLV